MLLAVTVASAVPVATGVRDAPRDEGAAAAAHSAPPTKRISTSGRVEAGVGLISAHADLELERWFSDWFGGGVQATAFGASLPFRRSESAYGGGVYIALRGSATGNTPLLTLGGGIAEVRSTESPDGFCIDVWSDGSGDGTCEPVRTAEGLGAYFGVGLGWLFHPGLPKNALELGPVLRLDIASELPAITLNFALGAAYVL
ncbi:MAG: hypothetical protein JW940_02955 [Polyangiaceae bacterium]|nr:hypothetical protein [Polyangiaceae bacterium]